MNKRKIFLNLLLILFLAPAVFAGESPYNPNASPTRYLFCTLSEPQSRTVYYSSIFLTNEKKLYPTQNAYLQFVAQKYSYKIQAGVDEYHMPVQCYGLQSSHSASLSKTAHVQDDQQNAYKVIETKWTFGSEKAVEEAAPSSSPAPASSGSPASPSAGPAGQDQQLDSFTLATLQQDPRGLNLSPMDRQFVLSEAPKAKKYCASDPELSGAVDCTCFVRTVFNYRIAHATGPIQTTVFAPLNSLLTKPDFVCSECVLKNASRNSVPCDRANNPH